jgi:hypothetical protein
MSELSPQGGVAADITSKENVRWIIIHEWSTLFHGVAGVGMPNWAYRQLHSTATIEYRSFWSSKVLLPVRRWICEGNG